MEYVELTAEEIVMGLSDKPLSLMEPVLDELYTYKQSTFVVDVEWSKLRVEVVDGKLNIEGFPVHQFVEWRITNYIISANKQKMVFWEAHPEIWVQVIKAGIEKFGKDGKVYVCQGMVVALSILKSALYSHLDFVEPMVRRIVASQRQTGHPMAIAAFQVDPVWTHVKIVPLATNLSKYQIGYQLDANFLFKPKVHRASFGPFLKDFVTESTLNLECFWSIAAPKFDRRLPDLYKSFNRKLDQAREIGLIAQQRKVVSEVAKMHAQHADLTWRQATMVKYQSQGVGAKKLRQVAAEFGRGTRLEFVLKLLELTNTYPLDRRLMIENQMAQHLQEGIK